MIEQFHFIRPLWLIAIIPLLIICGLLLRRKLSSHNWHKEVDPALLPYLLITQNKKNNYIAILCFFTAGIFALLAMAGPSWEKLPQPLFKKQAALIIALDLSHSMDAVDLKPSRLTRAKFKIADILQRRHEGQTGLIVYAATTYTVSPVTEDTATIDALLPSLSTDIMPAEGNNTSHALNKAVELLHNAGFNRGDILLVSDALQASVQQNMDMVADLGFRVSMLAVGTTDGAPIPLDDGGFLKDGMGKVIVPKLEATKLRSIITSNNGLFSQLSIDDSDIESLMPLIDISAIEGESLEVEIETDIWRELGPWLLLVVLPLAALAFRRGYLIFAVLFILPIAKPAHALSLNELFTSDNDRAMALFKDEEYEDAALLFDNEQWKAAALYRIRQYQLSIDLLENFDTAKAHYNRGNALTRQDEITKAIEDYSKAIELDPDHEDAKYNKALLEKRQDEDEQNQESQEGANPEQQEEDESKDSEAASGGDASQMNPEPQDEDQPQENTEASPSPPDNEPQAENEPTENDEQGQPSSQSSAQNEPEQETSEQGQQQDQQQNQQQDEQQQEQQAVEQDDNNEAQADEETNQETDSDEQQPLSDQTVEQWLNKVPDDPGGLLRRKFKYLYKKQQENIDKANAKNQ
ncbi:MAG: VWA domain-containing protein [Gammaproteobacteria bacterium]|nr:VWA domain-containing protein [Gammaproteobacteria bacterium]